jgi:hypothetical protein
MKTTEAETHLSIMVRCPECNSFQNQLEKLKEHLDRNELRAEDCEATCQCEDCGKYFVVNKITY